MQITDAVVARLPQLAAHETGPTLGLSHNDYDSQMGRISVMDYPHPLVNLKSDGTMDLGDAYAAGRADRRDADVRLASDDRRWHLVIGDCRPPIAQFIRSPNFNLQSPNRRSSMTAWFFTFFFLCAE